MRLSERVVLITGASSGLGRSVALALAHRGNRVAVVARRGPLLDTLAEEIRGYGSDPLPLVGDALDPEFAQSAVNAVLDRWGRLDACLLNIGHGPTQDLRTIDAAAASSIMRLNYDTLVNFFFPVAAVMKTQPEGGLIAHTNSLAGYLGIPLQGPYCAAKAAGRLFMETAQIELADQGVRAITICPGFIGTGTGNDEELERPFEVTVEQAADAIIRAMEREDPESAFPRRLYALTRVARWLPRTVRQAALRKVIGGE